jgi:hypothetical protein
MRSFQLMRSQRVWKCYSRLCDFYVELDLYVKGRIKNYQETFKIKLYFRYKNELTSEADLFLICLKINISK